MGLHGPIAYLAAEIAPDFTVVDSICGDWDFEDGGNPVELNRILAATDPVLCDAYVCHFMGYEVEEVPYIKMAEALGAGDACWENVQLRELNTPKQGEYIPKERKDVNNICADMCLNCMCDGHIKAKTDHTFSLLYENDAVEYIYQFINMH